MTGSGDQPGGSAAWTSDDLATNVHAHAAKADKVRRMFGAIARSYDLNNRLHSFWRDEAWRRFAVREAALSGGESVLDAACGTGDLTFAFARAMPRPARVVGLDFTREMLDLAEYKLIARGGGWSVGEGAGGHPAGLAASNIQFVQGDAMALPFADGSFDVVSIAFGIRNVADPSRVLSEFLRVLRPGGRLVVLEFDRPRLGVVRWASDLYTRKIMPITASLISGDRSGAYRYLPRSVEGFLDRDALGALITRSGFTSWRVTPLALGVCCCHRALKP